MLQPPLSFLRRPNAFKAPRWHYVRGWVCLGELEEPFWSSTAIWNADRYRQSWRDAARRCLTDRQPVNFYTDVTARAARAYNAVPHGRDILLFEMIFTGAGRPISRPLVTQSIMRERKSGFMLDGSDRGARTANVFGINVRLWASFLPVRC